MTAYLRAGQRITSLHNRLFLLWASSKLHGLLSDAEKQAILEELGANRSRMAAGPCSRLGHWKKHDAAAPAIGSNSYMTALGGVLHPSRPASSLQIRALARR